MPPPPPRRSRRRRRRSHRKLLIWIGSGVGVAVLLPVLVVVGLILAIDPNSYKAQLETSLRAVTGRDLIIRGRLSVSASLSPKLEAEDVTLANMPGGSRADMLRIEKLTIELAPRALLTGQFVVSRITLQKPDLLIETDAEGAGNWLHTGPSRATPAADGPKLALQTVHVRDGRVTWRDGRTGRSAVFDIRRIAAVSATSDSPVAITAEFAYNRQRIGVQAQTGPLARLAEASPRTPWGLFVTLESSGAKLTLAGALTRPWQLAGYSLRVDAIAQQLDNLSWLTDLPLPPLRNLTFTAKLLDTGGEFPDISAATLETGFTNLDKVAPGFSIESARIEMPRLAEPVTVQLEGTYASTPVRIAGRLGAPALLMPFAPPGQPYALDLSLEAAGATLAIRGAIAEPSKGTGMEIALGARIPDLASLGTLVGLRLPSLKSVAFGAKLVDGEGGYRNEIAVSNLVLTLPQGDLSGELAIVPGVHPRLRATLKSASLDADSLYAAWQSAHRAERNSAARLESGRVEDVTAPPPLPRRADLVLPDTVLPFALLAGIDADFRLAIEQLRAGGMTTKGITASLVLNEGRLVANPLSAELPGGHAELRLGIDARQATPAVTLATQASGIDLGALLPALGAPPLLTGKLDLDADLQATGRSWHALAATLKGQLAAKIDDGDIYDAAFGPLLPAVLQALRSGAGGIPRAEPPFSQLRCLSLHAAIAGGVATLEQTAMDSARLAATASGQVDLGAETMKLQLRPALRTQTRIIGAAIRADGGWLEPRLAPDPAQASTPAAGDACVPVLVAAQPTPPARRGR
jgi:uncharacterized protein involved in outer membrane biogenesis